MPPDAVLRALGEGVSGVFNDEKMLLPREGRPLPIEHSVAPIRDGAGRTTGCVIVFCDVSERHELEEGLRQSQKMDAVGKLAGGVAHDFNNALTAIIGFAELIRGKAADPEKHSEFADQILRAAEYSARLTQQLLAFSRKQILQPRELNLADEFVQMRGMLRRLIREDISLENSSAPDVWAVCADLGQIQQVIFNMAINARDAMPAGGELKIKLSNAALSPEAAALLPGASPGDFVLIEIADTGLGMTREVLARIFEPFFTTKAEGHGTGLGLATCYGIVKQSGGFIHVASAPGCGTTFSIHLPRAHRAMQGIRARPPVKREWPGGCETILVVEDEEPVRTLTAIILRGLGYSVLEAGDGLHALDLLRETRERPVDLVLADVVMPRMSGRELISTVHHDLLAARVLLMSGYTDDDGVRGAVQSAACAFLQKPFTPESLALKIREVLGAPQSEPLAA